MARAHAALSGATGHAEADSGVSDDIRVSFTRCIVDRERLIVRLACAIAGEDEPFGLVVESYDGEGTRLDAPCYRMGAMRAADGAFAEDAVWTVEFSVAVPVECARPRFRVLDEKGRWQPVSCELDPIRRQRLVDEYYGGVLDAYHDPAYDAWFKRHRVSDAQWERQRAHSFEYEPLVSIVVPLFNTPPEFLSDMYASVACQSYGNWELVLVDASPDDARLSAMLEGLDDMRVRVVRLEGNRGIAANTAAGIDAARGDFISFLDHDDLLEPDALFEYVKAVNEDRSIDMLYCDEDSWSLEEGYTRPHFKSDFNLDLLYTHNYVTHFLMVRAEIVRDAGASPAYVDGAQDYDLILRIVSLTRNVAHIPRVLYHWRSHEQSTSVNSGSKAYAQEAGRRALADHFARRGLEVSVESGHEPFTYVNRYQMKSTPCVSIVIPNKDHIEDLSRCIGSILTKATYPNYEVVIVENNSEDSATFAYYDEIARDERVSVVRYGGAFNFSKVVNFGVQRSSGEFVLLLNNDTEVITPDFIERMMGYFVRDEVGVVGAKLLFADGTVQHAGIVAGPFAGPWHLYVNTPDWYTGYMYRANYSQNYLAVTGACQMVRRSAFDEVGGYDDAYEVSYGDVDFCLRMRDAGKLVVYNPQVKLYHREFSSRGHDVSEARRIRAFGELTRLQSKWPALYITGDPYYSPNLDVYSQYCSLSKA